MLIGGGKGSVLKFAAVAGLGQQLDEDIECQPDAGHRPCL